MINNHLSLLGILMIPLTVALLDRPVPPQPPHGIPAERYTTATAPVADPANMARQHQGMRQLEGLRMRFTENLGQITDSDGKPRPDILYTADAGGVRLYFIRDGLSTVFLGQPAAEPTVSESTGNPTDERDTDAYPSVQRVTMRLAGSSPGATVRAEHELPGYTNYYYAHCPGGITHVKSYRKIMYTGIYPGIDLVYHAVPPSSFKYEFIVQPGASPADIRMAFEGADGLLIDTDGSLHVRTRLGEQVHKEPLTFTDDGHPVDCVYRVDGDEATFRLGKYDRTKTLVIDPWGMHFGGSSTDQCADLTVSSSGDIVFTGSTNSTNFPLQNAFQSVYQGGGSDVMLVSMSNSGSLNWSTYVGGVGSDNGYSLDLDASGNVFILGKSNSSNFPMWGTPFQNGHAGAGDYVLAKFTSAGSISWSTYFGGVQAEASSGDIAVDPDGNVVFIGGTVSSDFPTYRAFQTVIAGNSDCVLGKMTADGRRIWSTFFGATENDAGRGIAVDQGGRIYCTGSTTSLYFPLVRAIQSTRDDMFLSKFDSSGQVLIWSTYYGGSGSDQLYAIWVGPDASFTVTGGTSSNNLNTQLAYQSTIAGGTDGAIARFDSSCAQQCCTYLGGNNYDYIIALDGNSHGDIAIGGTTSSTTFPTLNAMQNFHWGFYGHNDAIMGVMTWSTSQGFQPSWLTYFGDTANYGWSANEYAVGIGFDGSGNVNIGVRAGRSLDTLHPWLGNQSAGGEDAIIMQLDGAGRWPVRLSSLSARMWNGRIQIAWRCESEQNNLGFDVQRSFTAGDQDWETRGFVPGAGSGGNPRDYTFIDDPPPAFDPRNSIFYRLKQIDHDGTVRYSPVVEVFPEMLPEEMGLSPVYPLPADQGAILRFSLREADRIAITLHDALGRETVRLREAARYDAGMHAIPVGWTRMPTGVYYIRLSGTRSESVRRIVVRQ